MDSFLDSFGLKRRQGPRIAVRWWIDVRVPGTEKYAGFFASDIGVFGVRLQGDGSEAFARLLSKDGRANMLLRVPGHREAFAVEAELRWGMGRKGRFRTGWKFTHITHRAQKVLNDYIEAHPEDILQCPRWT